MAHVADFLPLRSESILTIRARLDADVNAGNAPEDATFIDTIEGGTYFDMSQPVALEFDRLWDFLATEVPAAAFITYAYGDYLDEHGAVLGVDRKAASPAIGEVTFSGPDGTAIGTGTAVAVPNLDPDSEEETSFHTTDGGVIAGGTLTVPIEADTAGTAGNVASGTISLILTPLGDAVTVTNASAVEAGTDVEEDDPYRIRLLQDVRSPGGVGNQADYERWALAYNGIGFVTVNPLWKGPGTVQVIVRDPNDDPVTALVEDGLQTLLDPPAASTLLDGAQSLDATTLTVASTEGYRDATVNPQRLNILDYVLTYTGMTATTFTGVTGGPAYLAPDETVVHQGGVGKGIAPIGAEVTVDTPSTLGIDVGGAVTTYEGYSLDGEEGTIALRDAIEQAIRDYIDSLPPGEDVRINRVEAAFFQVEGVYDVSGVTINAGTANIAIGNDPPVVAITDDLSGITWAGADTTP